MRTLASSIVILPLLFGCGDDDSTGDDPTGAATMVPATAGSDSSAGTTAPSSTTEDPPGTTTTGIPPGTTTDETADGSTEESGSTSAGGGDPGDWLLTVDRGSNPPRLVRADLAGGVVEVCSLAGAVDYLSIAFAPDGTLYGLNGTANRIDTINPCNCSFQIVGPTSLGPIALDRQGMESGELLAVDPALDALVRVDVATGLGTVIGPLGFMFGTADLAWSDLLQAPYAVEGDNDFLYTVDPVTGAATPGMPLSQDVTDPGLAVHPNDNGLYACSGDTLYTVDASTGLMTAVGPLGLTGACRTLTPPQTAIECIDSL